MLPCCHYYCKQCLHQLTLRTGINKPFSCPECRKDTTLPEGGLNNLPTAFFVNRMKEVHSKLELAHGKVDANCEIHNQPMNIYCYDCKSLISTIMLHRNHFFDFVIVAAPKIKQTLIEQLNPLCESKSNMLRAIDSIYTTITEVEDQGRSVAKRIESSFAELHKIIDNRKQQLLTEATVIVEQKSQHLSEQEEGLLNACVAIESMIDYTEQCVEHLTDDKIMCMHTKIQSRINGEVEEQQKERKDLEPVEEVDLGVEVNCAQDMKQLCRTKAGITKFVVRCTITGEGLVSAEVNKTSQFELLTRLSNGRPTKQSCALKCRLKSLATVSTTECQVQLITGNRYRIQYIPTVRGRHELIVTVNGHEVAGSPFPVFVSIHPTLLGRPVRVITWLIEPQNVAVTPTGDVIVTESENTAIFDKNGKKVRNLDLSKYGISNPWGVTVDNSDGCVFITERNTILKLSPEYNQVGKFSGDTGYSYRHMAVVGDKVMVIESENNVVMVYSKNLKYVRQFGSYGKGPGQFRSIQSISSGDNSNLYVSDCDRECVLVFSNSGDFLHSFGKKLSGPVGVCVAGQYVYVGDYYGDCVSVFTTEGEYVTSFGQEGENGGEVRCPLGVCVDEDGFVYVCGYDNDRVQVF